MMMSRSVLAARRNLVNPIMPMLRRTTMTNTNEVQSGKGEVDVATIPILTTDSHPLGRIVKVHGVVSATSVRNKNILVDAWVAIKGIVGGSAPLYEDLINEAYVSAANGLAEAAHNIGATHVVQVRFEKAVIITRFVIGTHCFVSAYGTAVDVVYDNDGSGSNNTKNKYSSLAIKKESESKDIAKQ